VLEKDKDKEKEEELDKMSAAIIVGQSEEYDTLLRDLNAREKVNIKSLLIINRSALNYLVLSTIFSFNVILFIHHLIIFLVTNLFIFHLKALHGTSKQN
jgi:hypothetical protein